jgi:hypothetical protein
VIFRASDNAKKAKHEQKLLQACLLDAKGHLEVLVKQQLRPFPLLCDPSVETKVFFHHQQLEKAAPLALLLRAKH